MKLQFNNAKIWQVGSGDETRPFDKICLDYGIAIVGPGLPGDARDSETKLIYQNNNLTDYGSRMLGVSIGDYVILRRGVRRIVAVGRVKNTYGYSELLSDVYGWDLNHYLTVDWYIPTTSINFNSNALVQDRFCRVHNPQVINRINNVNFQQHKNIYSLDKLIVPNEVQLSDLIEVLIKSGVRIGDAENVIATIGRIIKLTKWYISYDPSASEHELRTFLVIPLLISLGWSEQKIKIEYKYTDIAIFDTPFRANNESQPVMIIETKTFNDGLLHARNAIHYYSKNYPNCNMIIATNGYRYIIEERISGNFQETCYINLLDLREHHYLNSTIKGAKDALLKMSNH